VRAGRAPVARVIVARVLSQAIAVGAVPDRQDAVERGAAGGDEVVARDRRREGEPDALVRVGLAAGDVRRVVGRRGVDGLVGEVDRQGDRAGAVVVARGRGLRAVVGRAGGAVARVGRARGAVARAGGHRAAARGRVAARALDAGARGADAVVALVG